MKLEIPIIVGFDDLEGLLDDLKKLQTYKLFEGDEMVLVDLDDVADVLAKHIKAKEKRSDTSENTCEIERKSNDTISRADAIDALENCEPGEELFMIENLPSAQPEYTEQDVRDSFNSGYACGMEAAQPERNSGEWTIKNGELAFWDVCSECRRMVIHKAPFYNFCPNCGADMRGDEHETN